MSGDNAPHFLDRSDGERLAYHRHEGQSDFGLLWLGGFKSDMDGTKALAIEDWAKRQGLTTTRFDYFAHGQSTGDFRHGTISRWRDDAEIITQDVCQEPQILIGSSMGGWIALALALAFPERVKAICLIAPAPDFTGDLMWDTFSEEIQQQLREGIPYEQPSEYDDEPYLITPELIEDGRKNFLLTKEINLTCPVRILQGMADPDVPWARTLRLAEQITSPDIDLTFVKQGDHRFSSPHCLTLLINTLSDLAQT